MNRTLKRQELIQIEFVHNGIKYATRVFKHTSTAILMPDKTVFATSTTVHSTGPRRNHKDIVRVRQIFNFRGNLNPLDVIRKPGDWDKPLETKLSLVLAEPV